MASDVIPVENAAMRDEGELDPARRTLLALVRANPAVSLKSLSLDLGRASTYLQDYIDGSPRELKHEDREIIARKLGVASDELKVVKLRSKNAPNSIANRNDTNLSFDYRERRPLTKDLPIRGHVKAGREGFYIDQGEHWGFAMRPDSLTGNNDAYAVRVHDDSMVPRFDAGHVLQVDPHRVPKPGDNVVIQLKDGQSFIKVLVRRTEKAVICEQFNPSTRVEYKPSQVKAIHMVVGIDFLER